MTEPTEEAYEAGRAAADEWHGSHRRPVIADSSHIHGPALAVVDAVWPLAFDAGLAEGCRSTQMSHGYTNHNHPCCRLAHVGQPEGRSTARCGGPAICTKCAQEAAQIHNRNR